MGANRLPSPCPVSVTGSGRDGFQTLYKKMLTTQTHAFSGVKTSPTGVRTPPALQFRFQQQARYSLLGGRGSALLKHICCLSYNSMDNSCTRRPSNEKVAARFLGGTDMYSGMTYQTVIRETLYPVPFLFTPPSKLPENFVCVQLPLIFSSRI